MKKVLVILVMLVSLVFTGCSGDKSLTTKDKSIGIKDSDKKEENSNTINFSKLTDREKIFLNAVSNSYFVFDYNVGKDFRYMVVWIDKYQLGKKVHSFLGQSTSLDADSKGIISVQVENDSRNIEHFIFSVSDGKSCTTGKLGGDKDIDLSKFSWIKTDNSSNQIKIKNNEIVLGSICYISLPNPGSSLSQEFFSDPEKNIEEIKKYDNCYLVKCKFFKEQPNLRDMFKK
ncbi:hypothetical protein [Clostridium sp. C8-1-8]|uniref:hypothetical protein n=1 Tax=Clostridium sp. C8-1-8 TaxID=2698831 RepID=UPI001369E64A|nr:hypothetical protein [Clostridium sp. C8-1-8]